MAYATGSDIASRYDVRLLGDLCTDGGDRISDLATLIVHPNVVQALEDASGMINSAALVGHRYNATDLQDMTGEGAAFLKRITCDLAFAFLRQRRGYDLDQYPTVQESFRFLDRLRLGERVFDIEANETAGNPGVYEIPTYVVFQQPLLTNNSRYWPTKRFPWAG
jgi:phage gp36-like protein